MMNNDHYPEILQTLKDGITRSLLAQGIDKAIAEHCAHTATEEVRTEWGGQLIYIGKGMSYEISSRDLEIWHKFNGKNHHELCNEYAISKVWLYKIIKHQRKMMVKRQQVDLFPEED
jgi:Mor family transcriptional regulator